MVDTSREAEESERRVKEQKVSSKKFLKNKGRTKGKMLRFGFARA